VPAADFVLVESSTLDTTRVAACSPRTQLIQQFGRGYGTSMLQRASRHPRCKPHPFEPPVVSRSYYGSHPRTCSKLIRRPPAGRRTPRSGASTCLHRATSEFVISGFSRIAPLASWGSARILARSRAEYATRALMFYAPAPFWSIRHAAGLSTLPSMSIATNRRRRIVCCSSWRTCCGHRIGGEPEYMIVEAKGANGACKRTHSPLRNNACQS
jgi:hypothetical protein